MFWGTNIRRYLELSFRNKSSHLVDREKLSKAHPLLETSASTLIGAEFVTKANMYISKDLHWPPKLAIQALLRNIFQIPDTTALWDEIPDLGSQHSDTTSIQHEVHVCKSQHNFVCPCSSSHSKSPKEPYCKLKSYFASD